MLSQNFGRNDRNVGGSLEQQLGGLGIDAEALQIQATDMDMKGDRSERKEPASLPGIIFIHTNSQYLSLFIRAFILTNPLPAHVADKYHGFARINWDNIGPVIGQRVFW